ncbi:LysR family transcriptional regulator [Hoeflea ulvae]|uniref:LysR substrate-binding domain-containing protein n=1 Tax=Hoeflea ulvae TaxID=2983764 RepID=A0ABT3YC57_9HYPH|nr:LysR family transcriptional regulator [Hoeflea ulvae]MCY0093463.1 LysR substrate-binding domain-containing protein [Hoeflea ulvae]
MNEFSQIKAFLAVAELHSFVAAARQLAMTAPSVTRAVSALEERLGVQLLLRTTRQVSLTSAGAIYAARVGPLLAEFEKAGEEVREQQGEAAGLLRINAPLSLGLQILPEVASGFRAQHPETALSLHLTDRFIDIVSDNIDLAIRISQAPGDKSTIWRKVCRVRRVLVAAPDYLAAAGSITRPEDLHTRACLAYDEEALSEIWELSYAGRSHKVRAGQTLAGNNGDLIGRLAENGEGVALLPLFIVEPSLSAERLQQVLPDWEPTPLWLTLYYPPYEKLPLRVKKFSDFFENYVTRIRSL